jgi:hypothetical protein
MRIASIGFAQEDRNRDMRNINISERPAPNASPGVNPPIEYVTNNGFRLVRLSELHPSSVNPNGKCHFMVQPPGGEEREVSVDFDTRVIAQAQSQRHNRLSESSDFWVTLAEQHLATYLWKNNRLPAGEILVVSQLSSHDLALAASWRD